MNVRLKEAEKIKVASSKELCQIMQRILTSESRVDRNREHFWTVSLDNAKRILNIEMVSMGSINKTLAEPMEVFSIPLQKRAVHVVLVHNHPSGELVPSFRDKDLTDHLIQVGRIMQVPVLDHLIITENAYYSFADTGLLKELEQSLKYVPPYEIKLRYEKAALEEGLQKGLQKGLEKGEQKGQRDKAKMMALAMKKNGEPISKIVAYTGLSRGVISRLKAE